MGKLKVVMLVLLLMSILMFHCGEEEDPPVEYKATIGILPAENAVVINEVFQTHLKVKNIENLMTVGTKIYYDKYKLEVVELARVDSFLTSNGGNVIQIEFENNQEAGMVNIGLTVPAGNAVSCELDDVWHPICKVVFRALSPGSEDLTIDIDHQSDGDVGLFDKFATLIEGVVVENAEVNISN
ncbi:hypothetical protein JW877_04650 [bacterium]|nr:hypothetical protein [bacterium]